jgi:3'-phosphoadenosine 5'-phosphosulfate (PAPS) 3'-phosphatase
VYRYLAFEAAPKIWDLAGGWLLVKEAGGIVESMDGPLPFPLQQGIDYRTIDYPTLAGASRENNRDGQAKNKAQGINLLTQLHSWNYSSSNN